MKNKKKFFPFPRPYIFVPMCVDFLHHGHINVFLKARKYGKRIIAGLMTDEGIKKYKKKKPVLKFKDRKKIGVIANNLNEIMNAIINLESIEEKTKISSDLLEKEITYLRNSKNRIKEVINKILIERKIKKTQKNSL